MKEPRELEKGDRFYCLYGNDPMLWRVVQVTRGGVVARLPLLEVFLPYKRLEGDDCYAYVEPQEKWWSFLYL